MPTTRSRAQPGADPVTHANEVRLVGRLAAEPVRRELPSGDVLVSFRLVVQRQTTTRGASAAGSTSRSPTVDAIDCAAWRKDVHRSLGRAAPGDVLEVEGALRRRFWRSAGGAASRSEVEVMRIRRVPAESG
ncbi:MAG: single-stranded DNA-binding protein [Actinomycetes bacterium]